MSLSRRQLFISGAALAASAALPRWAAADDSTQRPHFSATEDARRRTLSVDAPIYHQAGRVYRDTDFVVSPRFQADSTCALIYAARGSGPVVISNCTLRTPWRTWDPMWTATPIWRELSALGLAAPDGLTIDGLHVEGFPNAALTANGLTGGSVRRMSATRCGVGVNLAHPNRGMIWDYLRVWDLWGKPGCPSQKFPGQNVGGDCFAGYLDDSTLRYFELTGEMFVGFKLVRAKRVHVLKLLTPSLMIQGTEGRHANLDGSTSGSEGVTLELLHLDKGVGGSLTGDNVVGCQVSWNVKGLAIHDAVLRASGKPGHGVQLWGDCQADIRASRFDGWNGAGVYPGAACEIGDGSTINSDFEAVNSFRNQDRVLVRR